MSEPILVLGATGQVGARLVQMLAHAGRTVRAATRRPEGYAPPGRDVVPVRFDLEAPGTWADAAQGLGAAFVIAPPGDVDAHQRVVPFLDALSQAAPTPHVVLLSAMGVEAFDWMPLHLIEQHLADAPLPATVLRPNWFMQNFYPGFLYPSIAAEGILSAPAEGEAVSFVDAFDVAAVAAQVLETPHPHRGRRYTLTGPEALTFREAADVLSSIAGRPIRYEALPEDAFRDGLEAGGASTGEVRLVAAFFEGVRQGEAARVTDTVEALTGRAPRTLATFARDYAGAFQGRPAQ